MGPDLHQGRRGPGVRVVALSSQLEAQQPALATLYAQNPVAVMTTNLAVVGGVADALIMAAIFAADWWALLASWAGLQGGLPKILSYLGLLFGAVSILFFAIIPPFNPLGAVLGIDKGLAAVKRSYPLTHYAPRAMC